MKLLFFKDRETILRKARELKDIMFSGVKVFFSDFSAEKQRKRVSFVAVTNPKAYAVLHLTQGILYPKKIVYV